MNSDETFSFERKPFYQLVKDFGDSSQIFSEEYKTYFIKKFPQNWNMLPLSTILRRYSDNFNTDLGSKLKILQLGCGPNYGYNSGPRLDRILTQEGAKVLNLDIEERATEHYAKGSFVHGSCLELDKYFSKGEFDVIFMDQMDPELDDQIRKTSSDNYLFEKYLIFVNQIMDKLKDNGMFFISNANQCCFRITDGNLMEVKKKYNYSFFNNAFQFGTSIGLQVYERA